MASISSPLQSRTRLLRSHFQTLSRSHFSTQPRLLSPVELVFDRYEPPSDTKSAIGPQPPTVFLPPIVFLHGLFGSRKNNRTMSKILAKDLNRTVYALDLRNHGDSPHTDQHTYTLMAEDVEHFIRKHNLTTPSLIGHSMGAKVAMAVALRSPALLESIVSVDNAPVDASLKSEFPKFLQAMRTVERAGVKKQSDADEILRQTIPELPIRQFILTNMIRPPPSSGVDTLRFRIPLETLSRSLDALGDFPFKVPADTNNNNNNNSGGVNVNSEVTDKPVRFSKPALFVRGIRSGYMSDETIPTIGRFFPLFKLADIESGHWVISENPQAFKEAAVRFYEDLQDD